LSAHYEAASAQTRDAESVARAENSDLHRQGSLAQIRIAGAMSRHTPQFDSRLFRIEKPQQNRRL
jgi:hypothetical protein